MASKARDGALEKKEIKKSSWSTKSNDPRYKQVKPAKNTIEDYRKIKTDYRSWDDPFINRHGGHVSSQVKDNKGNWTGTYNHGNDLGEIIKDSGNTVVWSKNITDNGQNLTLETTINYPTTPDSMPETRAVLKNNVTGREDVYYKSSLTNNEYEYLYTVPETVKSWSVKSNDPRYQTRVETGKKKVPKIIEKLSKIKDFIKNKIK